jgi:catechol-2,3-dioxygenase
MKTAQVRRLNHAVLYVRDARRAAAFYEEAFGFEPVTELPNGAAVFLRAAGTENHHDLGLFSLGEQAPLPEAGRVGLYHLAWQVDTIHDLADMRARLMQMGALAGESDHGATKSLYGKDPDGNEFEVMWMLPRDAWGDFEHTAPVERLDLAAEVARWSGVSTGSPVVAEPQ